MRVTLITQCLRDQPRKKFFFLFTLCGPFDTLFPGKKIFISSFLKRLLAAFGYFDIDLDITGLTRIIYARYFIYFFPLGFICYYVIVTQPPYGLKIVQGYSYFFVF